MKTELWSNGRLRLVVTSDSYNVEYQVGRNSGKWAVLGYFTTLEDSLYSLWQEILRRSLQDTVGKPLSKGGEQGLRALNDRLQKGYREAEQEIKDLIGALKPRILSETNRNRPETDRKGGETHGK